MKKVTESKSAKKVTSTKPESKKKTGAEVPAKSPAIAKARTTKKTLDSVLPIDKACEVALAKLKELSIDENLQSEIKWCLGSYANDGNPVGLYLMAKRALAAFTIELANGTKAVTTKFASDLERSIECN